MVQIKTMEAQYDAYLHDESRLMGSAQYIAFPGSLSEVAEVVRWCG
ncbi:MAG: FAD-binding oxidoreductase, partial [Clostridiales bacterium]|nr:FAD-binding oxidoreductase [Clostridiales bacterium]